MFRDCHHIAGVLALAAALALVGPAGAAGSSGEFTRAEANADGSLGSIAGSVTWTDCEYQAEYPKEPRGPEGEGEMPLAPPYCAWTPYVTIGPGSDASECAATNRWLGQLGDGISLVWSGGETGAPGTMAFDLYAVPLSGTTPQLACLSVVETAETGEEIPCMPPGPPLPLGWHCPFLTARTNHALAVASILAAPIAGTQPATVSHRRRACPRVRHAPRHRARSGCVRLRHRHHRRHLTHS